MDPWQGGPAAALGWLGLTGDRTDPADRPSRAMPADPAAFSWLVVCLLGEFDDFLKNLLR